MAFAAPHKLRPRPTKAVEIYLSRGSVCVAIYGMSKLLAKVFEHGVQGHHFLFDPSLLGRALGRIDTDDVDAVTAQQVAALADFLEREGDFVQQRQIIHSAPSSAQDAFVRLYFDYLFDYLERSRPRVH
jgi:hypothetical protein